MELLTGFTNKHSYDISQLIKKKCFYQNPTTGPLYNDTGNRIRPNMDPFHQFGHIFLVHSNQFASLTLLASVILTISLLYRISKALD